MLRCSSGGAGGATWLLDSSRRSPALFGNDAACTPLPPPVCPGITTAPGDAGLSVSPCCTSRAGAWSAGGAGAAGGAGDGAAEGRCRCCRRCAAMGWSVLDGQDNSAAAGDCAGAAWLASCRIMVQYDCVPSVQSLGWAGMTDARPSPGCAPLLAMLCTADPADAAGASDEIQAAQVESDRTNLKPAQCVPQREQAGASLGGCGLPAQPEEHTRLGNLCSLPLFIDSRETQQPAQGLIGDNCSLSLQRPAPAHEAGA